MRLSDYLEQEGASHEAFARSIGVHSTTVYRLCSGLSFPKSSTLKRIFEITAGKVTPNDFLSVRRPPPQVGGRGRPRLKKQATEKNIQYWLGIDTPATYRDSEEKYVLNEPHPFGFLENRRRIVREMQINDRIVNYITEVKRFFAVYEIVGRHVTNTAHILDGGMYSECVEVRPIILRLPENGISIDDLLDKLEIFQNLPARRYWGVAVKTSARRLPYTDGELILGMLQESPTV
jgi:hypothetical protein